MFRVKLALIIFGGVIVYWGYQQYNVSRGTSAEPVPVELAQLEKGESPPNNHVRIGEHISVYDEIIYEYSQSKYSTAEPTADTSVSTAYYPILSMSHPFVGEIQKLVEQRSAAGDGQAPPIGQMPSINSFAVLVKTDRFNRVGDLAGGLDRNESIDGLIINRIKSLDSDEEKLIKQSFPALDVERVLILEQNRKPASLFKSMGMMTGGLLLALVGGGLFFVGSDDS